MGVEDGTLKRHRRVTPTLRWKKVTQIGVLNETDYLVSIYPTFVSDLYPNLSSKEGTRRL